MITCSRLLFYILGYKHIMRYMRGLWPQPLIIRYATQSIDIPLHQAIIQFIDAGLRIVGNEDQRARVSKSASKFDVTASDLPSLM